jgi:hypothetical protein
MDLLRIDYIKKNPNYLMIVYFYCNIVNREASTNTVVCSLPKALAWWKAAFSDENDLGPLPHPLVLYLCNLRNKVLVRFVPALVQGSPENVVFPQFEKIILLLILMNVCEKCVDGRCTPYRTNAWPIMNCCSKYRKKQKAPYSTLCLVQQRIKF